MRVERQGELQQPDALSIPFARCRLRICGACAENVLQHQLASLNGGYGKTQDSVRLFIVPGMGHCGGGVSPNSFDTLQALHNWVTIGTAPEGIIATATNGRTMPLCKFPEEARYLGSGDVTLAANWTCNANDTRMLRVGGNGTAAGADTATALQYLYEAIGFNGQ